MITNSHSLLTMRKNIDIGFYLTGARFYGRRSVLPKHQQTNKDNINRTYSSTEAGLFPRLHGKVLVAAIDFGTTFSGWSFAFKHEHVKDPTDIAVSQWYSGESLSLKTPTTVLIKPDGKTLHAFGYEAETKYALLAADNEHTSYYYFRRFKMMLYGKKDLSRKTILEDDKGLSLPAISVFALAIQYLKQNLMESLQKSNSGLEENDVYWVLTVPAIWNDRAKQFMREAAVQGGINGNDLTIALEPEAASMYTKLLPVNKMVDDQGSTILGRLNAGVKYMVIDAGGGTVDITVHQVLDDGHLREIYKASGGPWGGTKVDVSFSKMLETLVGANVVEKFRDVCLYDHLELFRSFEVKKRTISPKHEDATRLKIPSCLTSLLKTMSGKDLSEKISSSSYKDDMRLTYDSLKISADIGRKLFHETIDSIIDHVRSLLQNPEIKGTDTILMVGGFSESPMLQHAIKSSFPEQRVYIPRDAGLAVVKGAVIFGYDTSYISERVSKYTYGIDITRIFIEGKHNPDKGFWYDGKYRCEDIFDRYVEIGKAIKYGKPQGDKIYTPLKDEQNGIRINVFASSEKNPTYVTDEGCFKLGTVYVKILDMSVPRDDRTVQVRMTFSGTEIEVKAIEERTGNETVATIDFLE